MPAGLPCTEGSGLAARLIPSPWNSPTDPMAVAFFYNQTWQCEATPVHPTELGLSSNLLYS